VLAALTLSILLAAAPESPPTPSACEAAADPFPENLLEGKLQRTVEAYRRAWREACVPSARHRSLAPLLGTAEALARDPALKDAVVGQGEAMRALPGLAVDVDSSSVIVRRAAFAEAAALGTPDDRAFLPEWVVLAGDAADAKLPPWLEDLEGEGGGVCVKLGNVDWVDLARRLDALRAATRTPAYRTEVDRVAASIAAVLEDLERGRRTCACSENARVAQDLGRLAGAARKGGPVVKRLAGVAARAQGAVAEGRAVLVWERRPGQYGGGCRAAK
jgi:hypothetical protein